MAAPAPRAPGATPWQMARVLSITPETARAKTYRLALPEPAPHRAGQHCVVRLTAPDGYRAQRSYSIASAPDDTPEFEITVERLEGGEVSSFLHDEVAVGEELEVRSPIGGWFVWDGVSPALAVGGGSGIVPLVSMLRHARVLGRPDLLCLAAAARTQHDLPYAEEILEGCHVVALSQEASPTGRPSGRLTGADLVPFVLDGQVVYVCGSARFAAAASTLLVDVGVSPSVVRVERFGPSG